MKKVLALVVVLIPLFALVALVPAVVENSNREIKACISLMDKREVHSQDAIKYANNRLSEQERIIASLTKQIPYDRLQKVSVRVDVGAGCGTGVLVTRKIGDNTRTFVWTAGHVVECLRNRDGTFSEATIYQERRKDGKYIGFVKTQAKIIAYSDKNAGYDLAILEIQKDNFTNESAIFGDCNALPVGTELIHIGCTFGLYDSVSLGIISQTDRDILKTGKMFDQTSCMGYPGSSGGGVYLKSGECVGLLVRGVGPGLNFIIPVRRMLEWAKNMNVEWAITEACKVPTHVVRDDNPLDDGTAKQSQSAFDPDENAPGEQD